jgi:hypothetical protein
MCIISKKRKYVIFFVAENQAADDIRSNITPNCWGSYLTRNLQNAQHTGYFWEVENRLKVLLSEIKPEIGGLVHIAIAKPKINDEVILTVIGEIDHV